MVEYPYCTTIKKIKPFFDKIRSDVGIPPKVTIKWLESIGLKSKNDQRVMSVLKQIGFLDSNSIPTDRWKNYRTSKHKQVLAEGIRYGYSELFETLNEPYNKDRTQLSDFFKTKTSSGNQVIDKTVSTFLSISKLAEFDTSPAIPKHTPKEEVQAKPKEEKTRDVHRKESGMVLNINVQLTVPETTNSEVYEKFFEAMKRHLFP